MAEDKFIGDKQDEAQCMFAAECVFAGLAMAGFRASESDPDSGAWADNVVADKAWKQAEAMMHKFKERAVHYAAEAKKTDPEVGF